MQRSLFPEVFLSAFQSHSSRGNCLVLLLQKWIWKPTSALTKDQLPALCRSPFSHSFLLLQLNVGGSFLLGDVPSRYNLMWGFVPCWLPGCPALSHGDAHMASSLMALQQGKPKSCRAISTVPTSRHPADGHEQGASQSQDCKGINGGLSFETLL